ncbi:hypothetical protein HAX54_050342 [Datura stramonium]|uniref:Uncharacterized protein n=1 Tax=Datura stramonium TaxID=4076 RepID=A0ABS8WQ64_DATST|nr:hypothetical protein [Datura stramonium]
MVPPSFSSIPHQESCIEGKDRSSTDVMAASWRPDERLCGSGYRTSTVYGHLGYPTGSVMIGGDVSVK